jgi:hypothetical protein
MPWSLRKRTIHSKYGDYPYWYAVYEERLRGSDDEIKKRFDDIKKRELVVR